MALRTEMHKRKLSRTLRLFRISPRLTVAGIAIIALLGGIWLIASGDASSPLLFALMVFGPLRTDAVTKKLHRVADDETSIQSLPDHALLAHLKTVSQFGLTALHAQSASLTMWNNNTGQRVEWNVQRNGEPSEMVMANPEPCLRPQCENLHSAIYLRKADDITCAGLDWKQRPIRKATLLAYLKQAWREPFQSLLLSSLRVGSRWRGTLAYIDVPDPVCQRAELQRLQQFVAIATSGSDLFEVASFAVRADERRRIARDLHDGVTQSLIATELQLAVLQQRSHAAGNSTESVLTDVQELLRREIRNLRLQMDDLQRGSISDAVNEKCEELAAEFQRETHVATTFRCDLAQVQISPQVAFELSCLLAEALSNVRKHSKAKNVEICLTAAAGVHLTVQDDGCGCGFSGHHNLAKLLQMEQAPQSICERVHALGGDLIVDSSSESGTRLDIWIPLYALEENAENAPFASMQDRNHGARGNSMCRPPRSIGSISRRLRSL